MADDGRTRQERFRRHRRGDHSWCRPGSCDFAEAMDAPDEPGAVEEAVLALVEGLTFADADARRVTAAVALRLAQVVDRRGSATAAGQLQIAIGHLTDHPASHPGDGLDDIRARMHVRRLEGILRHVAQLGNGAAG
jgi:hypothetical protein